MNTAQRILLLAFVLIAAPVKGQFTDNFSDGNFTSDPSWVGTTNFFIVNSNGQLQSAGPAASSTIYIATASTKSAETEWNFYTRLDFTPSSQNYLRVYLVSDQADLTTNLNGYFLQFGGSTVSSESCIELYKQQGAAPGATPPVSTRIIQGIKGSLSASSNTVRVKVTRDSEGNWTLYTDYAGEYNFTQEGNGFESSEINASYFGLVCKHTSTRRDKFIFDDFTVNEVVNDTILPSVLKASPISASELEVEFSEAVSAATAQNKSSYWLDNGLGSPTLATIDSSNPTKVILKFDSLFPDRTECQLTVNDIMDLAGNSMAAQSVSFTYYAPYEASFGDIVINEMMIDEAPPAALPQAEFIELFNTSDQAINLAGFTLADDAARIALGDFLLEPDSFIILCATAKVAEFQQYGAVLGISLPNLRNSGELLTLRNQQEKIIDQVFYQQNWYNDTEKANGGWTLERINPYARCNNASNWTASVNELGGTPGVQNSVFGDYPDTIAPVLTSIVVIDTNKVMLHFSKSMDSLSLRSAIYSIDNDLTVQLITPIAPEYTAVELLFNATMVKGTVYTLKATGLRDCAGNSAGNISGDFGQGRRALQYEVVISEIFARETPKVGLPEKEFIELFNASSAIIDLSECLYSDSTSAIKLPAIIMMPGEYLILCSNSAASEYSRYGKTRGLSSWPALNNGGEPLTLRNPDGTLIFTVSYSDTWYGDLIKKDGGWSLEMVDPSNPCGGTGNWSTSEAPAGGTPGKPNSIKASNPDLTAPELTKAFAITASRIALYFNEPLDSISTALATYTATDYEIVSTGFSIKSPSVVYLNLLNDILPGKSYQITVDGIKDCSGNLIKQQSTALFMLLQQGEPDDIIINEILFNPNSGGVEFVELYNRSDKTIDLKNWKLSNGTLAGTNITSINHAFSPGHFLAISKDGQILKNQYPKAKEENFLLMPGFPALTNSAGTIVLINNLGNEMERLDYDENLHFALIDNRKGVSLERISYSAPVNNPNNWQSAASSEGYATPGYRNSQHLNKTDLSGSFFIHPKVFTPDEDGNADYTTINYKFEKGGYVTNINIFDDSGREVKKLVSNELLGPEGFYRWDGTNNQGIKARTGSYIILFEVFDLQGQARRYKANVIIGAKF
jgi:hypothetical protein